MTKEKGFRFLEAANGGKVNILGKPMEDKDYLVKFVCACSSRCHLVVSGDKVVINFLVWEGGVHNFIRGIYVLLSGRLEEARELSLCLVLLNCLQLKKIFMPEWPILG